ncbi:MAG: D-glycero-beta-D-manno-heptose-7-phosphate kinase [Chromatiaceae bacterium]|nr:MAG: D-glycero-beta-D-manno-heptose-7-phosphate kinase [Chromatiaceae bacterium]
MFRQPEQVLAAIAGTLGGHRLLLVGDLMLDRYLWGQVSRISPEAPVPVLHLTREDAVAGGAANVARNLVGLGCQVELAGVIGHDAAGDDLLAALTDLGIDTETVLVQPGRATTNKTRVIGGQQQMLRIDAEVVTPLTVAAEQALFAACTARLEAVDALLLSDYAKGVLTGGLCQRLIQAAHAAGRPVLIDPKGADFDRYQGATLMTPNRAELALATGTDAADLDALFAAGGRLRARLGLEQLVLTLGELGLALLGADGVTRIPALTREVFDVSGAGDTVIATIAAARLAGLDPIDSAHLANLAAGVVVGKVGTAAIDRAELAAAISGEAALEQAAKVCALPDLLTRMRDWRARGERIVFTNGCFDLLHVGHVTYLERARRHGQRLVVGLNSDRSVRALKGPQRPLIGAADRARVLAALAAVDAVVLFDSDTPLDLIAAIRPDVLAKGADYREEEVVGAREVRAWGGQVVLVPLVPERSTSGIIRDLQGGQTAQT